MTPNQDNEKPNLTQYEAILTELANPNSLPYEREKLQALADDFAAEWNKEEKP